MRAGLVGALLAVAVAAGCGGAAAGSRDAPCAGRRVHGDAALEALRGCRRIRGDLVVAGAVTSLAPLAELAAVDGALVVGPTLELSSASGLGRLVRVGGDLCVAGNPFLGGLFLPRLERIGGDLRLAHDLSATTVALHRLREIGGSLVLVASRRVQRVDLSSLRRVGGDVHISGMSGLEALVVPAELHVAGAIAVSGPLERGALPPGWARAEASGAERGKAASRRCSADEFGLGFPTHATRSGQPGRQPRPDR